MDLKIDPVLLLLFVGITIFTGVMIWVDHAFHDDGQIFQVCSGLVTGFAGAFFTRLKPRSDAEEKGGVTASVEKTTVVSTTATPEPRS